MKNHVELRVQTGHVIYELLWGTIKGKTECPYGTPVHCDIFGVPGPWRVVGWHKESGPVSTSPEYTTFMLRTCEETDHWRD